MNGHFPQNGDNIFVEGEDGKSSTTGTPADHGWLSVRSSVRFVDQFTSGFGPFEDGNAAIGFGEGWRIEFVASAGKVNYGVLPLPKGPHGDNTLYTGWLETWVLPSNAAQPEAMVALIDFLFRTENIAESNHTIIENRVSKWAPTSKLPLNSRDSRSTVKMASSSSLL